jgi:excisionase family DNA binding protein
VWEGTELTGPLLTARQVGELLGVSTETVLRWTRRGELPAIRLPGGAIRFREDELDGWLEERATTSQGASPTPLAAALGVGYESSPTPRSKED